MKTRKQKSPRKSLVATLDKAFKDYILERDHHRCVICGATEHLAAGHLFTRMAFSTRWEPRNSAAQCPRCNLTHEHDAFPFTNWFLSKYGDDGYAELHRRHRMTVKYSDSMLQEMIEQYRKERAELLAEEINAF